MFGSLCALPVLGVRMLAELVLLLVACTVVIRAHRAAGLTIAAGAGLALLGSVAAPTLEASAVVFVSSTGSSGGKSSDPAVWVVVMALLAGWIPFLTQAVNLALITRGVLLLVARIPPEQRDDLGGVAR